MGSPRSNDARRFYRCAKLRYQEAKVLLEAGFNRGAVYLAGYGVECILKALLLEAAPASQRTEILKMFRGSRAHEYDWLRDLYVERSGSRLPLAINRHFIRVNSWSTDLRYSPTTIKPKVAVAFMAASAAILDWTEGRF